MTDLDRTRRTVLTAGVAALATLAGCGDGSAPEAQPSEPVTQAATEATRMPTPSATDEPTSDDLDLREANVTDVAVTNSGDRNYRFDVTLYHDDDGEDGYADWWQVETFDGEQLGRRDLLHAHSTAPFTRSETVEIPAGVDCVVVRGHDQGHGYGGQAMLVTVDGGAIRAVEQGPERQSMADQPCP